MGDPGDFQEKKGGFHDLTGKIQMIVCGVVVHSNFRDFKNMEVVANQPYAVVGDRDSQEKSILRALKHQLGFQVRVTGGGQAKVNWWLRCCCGMLVKPEPILPKQ